MSAIAQRGRALALLMLIPAWSVLAAEPASWPAGQLLAGEIILQPTDSGQKNLNRAGDQRARARAQRQDKTDTNGPESLEEELEGILAPRVGQPIENSTDLRQRARDYQRGNESNIILQPQSLPGGGAAVAPADMSTHDRAADSLSRARRYAKGGGSSGFTGKVGPDGLPLVVCDDVGSAVGRIGDDTAGSGSLITVIKDGRSIKARCQ